MVVSNFLGFISNLVITLPALGEYGLMVIVGLMLPITVYNVLFKTKLNRLEAEKKND